MQTARTIRVSIDSSCAQDGAKKVNAALSSITRGGKATAAANDNVAGSFNKIEKASNSACVGCSCVPSPAFIILALICFARKCGAPTLACRITIISTFIAKILLTVSSNVSPFFTELFEAEKFMTSADSLFCASSIELLLKNSTGMTLFSYPSWAFY